MDLAMWLIHLSSNGFPTGNSQAGRAGGYKWDSNYPQHSPFRMGHPPIRSMGQSVASLQSIHSTLTLPPRLISILQPIELHAVRAPHTAAPTPKTAEFASRIEFQSRLRGARNMQIKNGRVCKSSPWHLPRPRATRATSVGYNVAMWANMVWLVKVKKWQNWGTEIVPIGTTLWKWPCGWLKEDIPLKITGWNAPVA